MIEDKRTRTEISTLGEFGLIDHLTGNNKPVQPSTIKAVGDDTAVLDYSGKKILVTTDLLLEGIHFNLMYTPLRHLGYKAVVVNLSDVCAMGGIPRQITVSIGLSTRFSLEDVDELYKGIYTACNHYGVDLVGGDTSSSVTGLTISVTAIGEASGEIVYRNGAKENDLICVSGNLGAAYAGLMVLEREKTLFKDDNQMQPDLERYQYVLERQLKPEARIDIVKSLHEKGVHPTSMIDISDGLSSELFHLCRQSKSGCRIHAERIPVDHETALVTEEFNMTPEMAALNGGEDYELLFTVPLAEYDLVRAIDDVHVIGSMTDASEGLFLVNEQGTQIELQAQGWTAFK